MNHLVENMTCDMVNKYFKGIGYSSITISNIGYGEPMDRVCKTIMFDDITKSNKYTVYKRHVIYRYFIYVDNQEDNVTDYFIQHFYDEFSCKLIHYNNVLNIYTDGSMNIVYQG